MKNKKTGREKRKIARIKANSLIVKIRKSRFIGTMREVEAVDFTSKGVGILTEEDSFDIGDSLFVSIQLTESGTENRKVHCIPAKIVNINEVKAKKKETVFRYGIMFNQKNIYYKKEMKDTLSRIETILSRKSEYV